MRSSFVLFLEVSPDVFYTQKIFQRSSLYKNPSSGLLYTEDLAQVFNTQQTFQRSSMHRNPCSGLLYPEDLPEVFNTQQTSQRYFILRRHSRVVLYTAELLKVFCIALFWDFFTGRDNLEVFQTSSIPWRPFPQAVERNSKRSSIPLLIYKFGSLICEPLVLFLDVCNQNISRFGFYGYSVTQEGGSHPTKIIQ